MLITLLVMGSAIVMLLGWGTLGSHRHLQDLSAFQRGIAHLILGTSLVILQLQLVHLIWPIHRWVLIAYLSGGLLLGVVHRRYLGDLARAIHFPVGYGVGILLLCAYLASPAISSAAYDAQWYHLPAIQWFNRDAAIQGFANMQHRFGFNNTNFLLVSLFSAWSDCLYQVVNGVWITLLLLYGSSGFYHLLTPAGPETRPAAAYRAVSLGYVPFLLGIISPNSYLNTAPELMVGVLCLFSIDLLLFAPRSSPVAIALALLGIATAATVKISAVFLVPLVLIVLLVRRPSLRALLGTSWGYFAITTVLIGLWLVRSWWFSGYLVFPAAISQVGAPAHQVPVSETRAAATYIYTFARHTYSVNGADIYVPNSALIRWIHLKGGLAWVLNGLLIALILRLAWWRSGERERRFLLPMAMLGLALLATYFTAPDFRFAWYGFSALTGLACATLGSTPAGTRIGSAIVQRLRPIGHMLRPTSVVLISLLVILVLIPTSLTLIESLSIFTPQQLVKLERFPNLYAHPELILLPAATTPVIPPEGYATVPVTTSSYETGTVLPPLLVQVPEPKPLCGTTPVVCLPTRAAALAITTVRDQAGHIRTVEPKTP